MKNQARIIDNVAVDVSTDPANCFHPTIAAEFVEVPTDVTPGSTFNPITDTWTIAPVPEPAPAPAPVTPAAIRRAEIESELTAIDAASARPLRAILTATTSGGTADPADVAKLAELEAQAKALRTELASLEA